MSHDLVDRIMRENLIGNGGSFLAILFVCAATFRPTIVENYSKGKNVEEPLSKDNIPIPDLPINFIWMQVGAGSKMRNLLGYAMKAFKEEKAIVWSGSGAAISKTISCAEIMKRNHRQVHQITKICYRKVEEYWEPQFEDLDRLVVVREVPTIHILLSKEPLNIAEPGYQAPGSFDAFWKSKEGISEKRKRIANSKRHTKSNLSPEEFAALGLRTSSSQKQSFAKSKQSTDRTVHTDLPESSSKEKSRDEVKGTVEMMNP